MLILRGFINFYERGSQKAIWLYGDCLKKGAWQKIGTRVFLRRGEVDTSAHYDLFVVHAGT